MINEINNIYTPLWLRKLSDIESDLDSLTENTSNQYDNSPFTWSRLPSQNNQVVNTPSWGLGNISKKIKDFIGKTTINPDGTVTTIGLGGLGGLASTAGALAKLYSIYDARQYNKRLDKAFEMQAQEHARAVQKDRDFANAVNKSGLGLYSSGLDESGRVGPSHSMNNINNAKYNRLVIDDNDPYGFKRQFIRKGY